MSQVNRKAYLARNNIDCPWFYIPFAHSDYSWSSYLLDQVGDCYSHMCCALQCVASQVHWRCTCVVRSPSDCDPRMLQPGNGCNDPKIDTFIEQDAALLNV